MTAAQNTGRVQSLAGGATASPAGQASWGLYEAAQGPYFVTITIALYAPFFANTIVGDPTTGQAYWGYVQGTAGLLVAMLSPFLGAFADAVGPRKPGLFVTMGIGTIGMTLLWFAVPGAAGAIGLAGALIVLCAVSMEFASVFHNAMLPTVVSAQRVGVLSGAGYAASYVGAIGTLIVWQLVFNGPEMPFLGLDRDSHEVERILGPMVALWTVLFSLPLLFLTPDQKPTGRRIIPAMREGIAALGRTFGHLRHYRNIALYLLVRTIYYDGVIVTYAFVGIYATGIFGWSPGQLTAYVSIVLIVSAIGGLAGGWVDDRIGSKRTILISITLFGLGLGLNFGNTPDTILFVPIDADRAAQQLPVIGTFWALFDFTSLPEQVFVTLGISLGIFGGPTLAASRTMMARLAPPGMAAQFFGLYTLTGKATSFSGPFLVGIITAWTGSQRLGLAVVLLYLLVGGIGMLFVREEQSQALPREDAVA